MKTHYAVGIAMSAGVAIGSIGMLSLHAQGRQPVYYVSEIDVANPEAYAKDYQPRAAEWIKKSGGRYIAAGKPTSFEGEPAKSRSIILAFDSMEKIQAWRNSPEFQDVRKLGGQYAKFRAFAIEGTPQ